MLRCVRLRVRQRGFPVGLVLMAGGAFAAAAVGLLHLDQLGLSLCVFKRATGLPCPTCGTTRTLGLLARGDALGALRLNPLACLAALLVGLWGLGDLWLWLSGRGALALDAAAPEARRLQALIVVLVAVNWVYLILAGR
jgi:hypothetical protein